MAFPAHYQIVSQLLIIKKTCSSSCLSPTPIKSFTMKLYLDLVIFLSARGFSAANPFTGGAESDSRKERGLKERADFTNLARVSGTDGGM